MRVQFTQIHKKPYVIYQILNEFVDWVIIFMENKSCVQNFVAFTYSPYLNVSFLYLLSHSSDRKDPIYIQMFYIWI